MKNGRLISFSIVFASLFLILLIPSCFSHDSIRINDEVFPDADFRKMVCDYDSNNDGKLSSSERAKVTYIAVLDRVSNLQGVEHFTELKRITLGGQELKSVDLSKNTKLESIESETASNLDHLVIGSNTNLTNVLLQRTNLTELDLSGCSSLKQAIICYNDKLCTINVNGCVSLETLQCIDNNLEKLDVSDCSSLKWLMCSKNSISDLCIGDNSTMSVLDCDENKLSDLDLTGVSELTCVNCSYNQLNSLNISRNKELKLVECNGNDLAELDVSGCPKLKGFIQDPDTVGEKEEDCIKFVSKKKDGVVDYKIVMDKDTKLVH